MEPANVILICIIVAFNVFLALFVCVYKVFFKSSASGEYSLLSGGGRLGSYGSGNSAIPRDFLNDEEALNHLAEEYDFTLLQQEEQIAYLRGEEFSKQTPPNFDNQRGSSYTMIEELAIRERGINAFEFEQDQDFLQPRFIVDDKTEINFINNDKPFSCCTSVLNYSLPVKGRLLTDIVYFETKVFEYDQTIDSNQHFAIGLVTKPYPNHFRLPGYNNFSISYESTGNLKINKPLPTPLQQHKEENSQYNALILPPLQQSDIVGFGYIISTGTIFITHNGKKVMDIMKGCFADLYPAVGCFQSNIKFQVNIGQLGFVWIEANVRKYGFVSSSDFKKIKGDRGLTSLPEYANTADKLLAKGEELPPRYPEEELDFFGRSLSSNLNPGTSAQLEQQNEKKQDDNEEDEQDEVDEQKSTNLHSSSIITNEPEDVMDLRERIYEQRTGEGAIEEEDDLYENGSLPVQSETQQLLSNSDDVPPYYISDKDETPELEAEASPEIEEEGSNEDFDSSQTPSREVTPNTSTPTETNNSTKTNKSKKKKKKNSKKKGKGKK
ncbi:protein Ssh4p [[Candida] railenensis]|uniref:Protein Ssh4p n=1 Tax=[Candida] railenensis TaxID=45579 RepID=A0A9P0QXH6_9ASCO|nr:protein Ssh4p [[Candida] railenensis]